MARSATIRNYTPRGAYDEDVGLDNDPMYYLQRLFVYFLQNLFRDFPEGCGLKWKPDEENTELLITAEKPRLEAVEKTPHITCVLGAAQWSGTGLDQFQTHRALDGERTHTDLMPMSMSYHCQAKEGMVARRIAWNASLWTTALRRILMRTGGLHQVGVRHSISPEGPISQFTGPTVENELVEVVVNVPFYWQPQWRIRRASEVWRSMSISMQVNSASANYSAGRAAKLRPPMVKGRPVEGSPIQVPPEEAFVQTVKEDQYFEE